MYIGRLIGWLLVAVAVLLASGDVVMALGPGDYTGIATGEVVTLLSGYEAPHGGGAHRPALQSAGVFLLDLPAWAVLGPAGVMLCWACRRRPRRFRFRHG